MPIKIFNSLSKKKEVFAPIDEQIVRLYVCGPTVYSRPHIGNARSIVIYDMLFRLLNWHFDKVTYARNITDVDDKINAAAAAQNISIQSLTSNILELFYQDIGVLNVLKPTFEPKATEHIDQVIKIIEKLIENGHAYESSGNVLFDVKSYKEYGELSNRSVDDMISGARIEVADYKKDPLDFILWKPASKNDDISSVFDSPWGKGRPGWHIECSAMSGQYLGKNFDIHGGGADLQFPHHENEIAQSKCANKGSEYAKYWVHNGFLTVNGEKMSKSLGNFITVSDLLGKNINPLAIRYLFLATHYRKPLDFNDKALKDATKAIDKFYDALRGLEIDFSDKNEAENEFLQQIIANLGDDLNTPLAFAGLHQLVKKIKSAQGSQKIILANKLTQSLEFLGLFNADLVKKSENNVDIDEDYILQQISLRKEAKKAKNWAQADKVRDDLLKKGIVLEDVAGGEVKWSVK
jgi:cysteinyl-tRNA synthetase